MTQQIQGNPDHAIRQVSSVPSSEGDSRINLSHEHCGRRCSHRVGREEDSLGDIARRTASRLFGLLTGQYD